MNFFVPNAALIRGRRLFGGGAYSSKYGTHSTVNSGYLYQHKNGGKVIFPVPITTRTGFLVVEIGQQSVAWREEAWEGEVWMVGEIATLPVRRIPTVTSSQAMNPNNNIYNICYKCL